MIKGNILQISMFLYFILVGLLIFINPYFIYNKNGKIKLFGTKKNKTLFPLWLIIFVIAVLSYYISVILVNF